MTIATCICMQGLRFCVSPLFWIEVRRFEVRDRYPAREPVAGAGLSGAPPTETGPTGLGSGDIIFRDVPTAPARVFECGMLEVVNGITALCRASTCAGSEES